MYTVNISAEQQRLKENRADSQPWRKWGPYLSERQWGTVREDYSSGGNAWDYLSHDQARSRAYRWGEDGLAGMCDEQVRLCLALALWNGRDPILKERLFGLTNARREPRRGRQRTLLLPRRHPHAFLFADALQVSAAGVPIRPVGRGEPPARVARTRVRVARYRCVR